MTSAVTIAPVDLTKPASLHDRDRPWRTLAEFASSAELGARLALVYGRRRQGKTLMLDLLAQATGGFIFTGLPLAGPLNLGRLARSYAAYVGGPVPAFEDWEQAIDFLLRLGERGDGPTLIVLDEFPYLIDAEPALPSILQIALEPLSRARTQSRARLVLCGSALHVMRGLLAGPAPLRGRADYEVVVAPFGYRDAAEFWGVGEDFQLAFQVHALVGGTPAYRSMCGALPKEAAGFDEWVLEGPLNPDRAIYREGAVLLHEEPSLSDIGLYYAVLTAIAQGACRRSEIAGVLGRTDNSLAHPLAVLEQTQLIERVEEAFRQRRPVYRIAEPILRLHQLIIAPNEADLVGGAGTRVWQDSADTVSAKIYGPHFAELARQWCRWHAEPATLGDRPSLAQSATLACALHRQGHELDVVVSRRRPGASNVVLAIGEAKSGTVAVGEKELERLEHLRDLLPADRVQSPPRLLLFSRGGFTPELRRRAGSRRDVELVDLERLYQGG
jgi:AAA+ ATPase superfamily predicted ATPase